MRLGNVQSHTAGFKPRFVWLEGAYPSLIYIRTHLPWWELLLSRGRIKMKTSSSLTFPVLTLTPSSSPPHLRIFKQSFFVQIIIPSQCPNLLPPSPCLSAQPPGGDSQSAARNHIPSNFSLLPFVFYLKFNIEYPSTSTILCQYLLILKSSFSFPSSLLSSQF